MSILKEKSILCGMRKQIIKCPVFIQRSIAKLFFNETANAREEEKINEIAKKIVDYGFLTGDRKYIPHGPVICSKLPYKADHQ
jgi:hypothetical protein